MGANASTEGEEDAGVPPVVEVKEDEAVSGALVPVDGAADQKATHHKVHREHKVRRVNVRGAGLAEVNGLYEFKKKFAGGECFQKESSHGTIYIRRQGEDEHVRNWRITLSEDGMNNNHLYKRDQAAEEKTTPPVLGWEACTPTDGVAVELAGSLGSPPEKVEYYHGLQSKMNFDHGAVALASLTVDETRHQNSAGRVSLNLQVGIIGASNLRDADWIGGSDPYCVCEIPGKEPENGGRSQIQTHILNGTKSPEWHFLAEMPDYEKGDKLYFKVWDKDWGKSDDFLGHVVLQESDLYPNGFLGEVALEGDDKNQAEGKLNLCIVLPEQEMPGIKVNINKKTGKIGVAIVPDVERDALSIRKVWEDGLIRNWNQSHPDQQVKAGDRIIAVNGERGSSQHLLKALALADAEMELLVLRNL